MSVTKTDRDLKKLSLNFQVKVGLWLKDCPEIFVTEAYRSQARQDYLYEQWRTRAWRKITWTKNSMHTKRLAVDIAFNDGELYPRDLNKRKAVAAKAKEHGIDWGYDLWKVDRPHFQDNWMPIPKVLTSTREPLILEAIEKGYYNGIEWQWLTDRVVLFVMKTLWSSKVIWKRKEACLHENNLPIWELTAGNWEVSTVNWFRTIKPNEHWYISWSMMDIPEEVPEVFMKIIIGNALWEISRQIWSELKFKWTKNWNKNAQIKIYFKKPGDKALPVNFKKQSLAYAIAPSKNQYSGHVYVNEKIDWSGMRDEDSHWILKILVHEFLHALNIGHSSNKDDIMYAYVSEWDHDITFTGGTTDLLNKLY